jgi:hypothetical protein
MALVLIRDGYAPAEAIDLIRAGRGDSAMCNPIFERWLRKSARLEFWRSGTGSSSKSGSSPSSQAA